MTGDDHVNAFNLTTFLQQRTKIGFQPVDWEDFDSFLNTERLLLQQLSLYTARHCSTDVDEDVEISRKLMECTKVIFNLNNYVLHTGRLLTLLYPEGNMNCVQNVNAFQNDVSEWDAKQTSLQKLLIILINKLESGRYFRCDGKLYKKTATNAFQFVFTIQDFVRNQTCHHKYPETWRLSTNPIGNDDKAVRYLTTCFLSEGHDLSWHDLHQDRNKETSKETRSNVEPLPNTESNKDALLYNKFRFNTALERWRLSAKIAAMDSLPEKYTYKEYDNAMWKVDELANDKLNKFPNIAETLNEYNECDVEIESAEKALEEATLNLENSIKKRKVMDDRATKIIDDVKNMTNSLEK